MGRSVGSVNEVAVDNGDEWRRWWSFVSFDDDCLNLNLEVGWGKCLVFFFSSAFPSFFSSADLGIMGFHLY